MAFADFPQQERVVQLLQRSLERGRLSHAYLFKGGSLVELEAVARTLAKTLNCQNPVRRPRALFQSDCCDKCPSCRKINEEMHPDVQWVRPESKSRIITIDQMRSLMQTISLKPTEAAWKVAVIVAADRMNIQAANAFLKTLEEPPPSSVILLLSTEPERILETVLSRCLRLGFDGEARPKLEAGYLSWLTEFSETATHPEKGLLGRYRLLGTLLNKLNELKAETEKTLSARSPLERYEDPEPRLRERWEDELAAAVEAEYRRRRGELLLGLQWWLRDVWLEVTALGQDLLSFPNLGAAAQAVAKRITPQQALENIEVLEQTQRLLGSNVQEALALEVGLLKAEAVSSPRTWTSRAWFASAFGGLLGLALLKFGNPIILDRLIEPPQNGLEFVFAPWPVRWGYILLTGCALIGMRTFRAERRAPTWVLMSAGVWLVWQGISAVQTIDARPTVPTVMHFGACAVCFVLGTFCLRRLPESGVFWLVLLAAFGLVLWTGFEQHYGGLQATRELFYQRPDWQTFPPEYLRKIQSNRIFSTLVYPNALAAAILLLLPSMLLTTWDWSARLTHASRAVIVGVIAYAALACLFWSGSKSGWLIALVLGMVALFRCELPRKVRAGIVMVLVAGGLIGFFVKYSSYFRRGAPSVSARFEYWRAALRTGMENPLLGTGPGTFSVAYRKIKPPGAEMAQLVHNDYLEQFCDSGMPGALAYAGFVLGSILLLPKFRPIFTDQHLFAVWLGLLGWGLQAFVEFLLYIPALAWTAFALIGWLWAEPPRDNAVDNGRLR